MKNFARICKALSDATRIKIVRLLIDTKIPVCVCELKDALNIRQYNVSYHLKDLKNSGLVNEKKEGKWVYYSLIDSKDVSHQLILEAIQTLPSEFFIEEKEKLNERLELRVNGKCALGLSDEEKPKKTQP